MYSAAKRLSASETCQGLLWVSAQSHCQAGLAQSWSRGCSTWSMMMRCDLQNSVSAEAERPGEQCETIVQLSLTSCSCKHSRLRAAMMTWGYTCKQSARVDIAKLLTLQAPLACTAVCTGWHASALSPGPHCTLARPPPAAPAAAARQAHGAAGARPRCTSAASRHLPPPARPACTRLPWHSKGFALDHLSRPDTCALVCGLVKHTKFIPSLPYHTNAAPSATAAPPSMHLKRGCVSCCQHTSHLMLLKHSLA